MTYTKEQALAALAAAPDEIANNLGIWTDEQGDYVRPLTREDVRQGLENGTTDPDGFMRNLSLVRWMNSPGAAEELERKFDAYRSRRRRETLRAVKGD
jgi:hypothetical protein